MPSPVPYTHAIVMGDLVDSQSASSIEDLHRQFNGAVADANRSYQQNIVSPLTITLGDEFQGLCSGLSTGGEIIRDIRANLIGQGVECRFVVGLATLQTPVNTENSWNMMGLGLAEARKRLNDKHDDNAYRFEIPDDVISPLLNTIGLSLTLVERAWTDRQKDIVGRLHKRPASIHDHAAAIGIAPRTLYKIRSAARVDFYEQQWKVVYDALKILDQKYGLA